MAGVVTIPGGRAFVDSLAERLLREHGADALALSQVTVFLPTRRSVRALREALLRRRGAPLLLPSIRPLGDVDEDDATDETAAGPPPVAALERQLLLAEQVRAWRERSPSAPVSGTAQTLALAASLAGLLDEMQTARLDFSALAALVAGELAGHWRETLDFLSIVTEHWPRILAERGAIDPADHGNRMLDRLAERWRRAPPRAPVIAAGSTGSRPATAGLLAVIAGLPNGLVVLPGLDADLDEASWEALSETHPQFGLKALLAHMDVPRAAVAPWPGARPSPRAALIREAMRPDATIEAWRALDRLDPGAVSGLEFVECPDEHAEAEVVALAMRRALETPGRTAALVTADRGLARRVGAALGRWRLDVDDSAGRPLAATPPGVFLRLVVEAFAHDLAPAPLLAMLKHPLSRGGEERGAFLARVRAFERACLRGPRPAPGFRGLEDALAAAARPPDGAAAWLARLAAAAAPFARALARDQVPLADLAASHRRFAEWLATDGGGECALWTRDSGLACRERLDELERAAAGLRPIAGRDYAAVIDDALRRATVRPPGDAHPRLFIWGPLEARLQQADAIVLGGLNEGSWPGDAAADPWLSRPMRHQIGLPVPERRIGLAAHDFAQLFQAPEVMLTRAVRVDGTPTVAARWLTRLAAVMRGAGLSWPATPWLAWRAALDRPAAPPRPVAPPAPRPPLRARPRRLSVTRIEAWMRDPYEIYARHVLRLRALDPIDAEATQADYGSAVHEALDRFVREMPAALPADALERLLAVGEARLAPVRAFPGLWAFWWPRFRRMAAWFVDEERRRRARGVEPATEIEGKVELAAPGGAFTLTAKADRLDRAPGGGVEIVDYKTGKPPASAEVDAGYAPQLPLEGAILQRGGFPGFAAAAPAALSYWRLSGGDPAGEVRPAGSAPAAVLSAQALDGLRALIARYDNPETPYLARPAPKHAPRYSDYEHLARVGEWGTTAADDA